MWQKESEVTPRRSYQEKAGLCKMGAISVCLQAEENEPLERKGRKEGSWWSQVFKQATQDGI